ncbi:O-linked N-acetylglucosamine transferase family protein [Candidatus Accumulibacter aalborgensis]|nr:tetratricopeptide repeat protein [Candidatus Accumulibacter aalborgensis]
MAPSVTLDEALAQALATALACQAAGCLCEAEQLYRAIVQARPDHPQANHQLGLLEVQRQQPAAGLAHFLAAVEGSPESSQYWLSYIDALLLAGQTDTAQQVLALGRQHGLAGEALDSLVKRLTDSKAERPSGKTAESRPAKASKKAFRKMTVGRNAKPSTQEESALVGLFNIGRYSEGESLARALTERYPDHGFGWKVLGAMLTLQGRDTEALPAMRHAARLLPRDEQVQSNLGLVLAEMGQLSDAEACHRRALKIRRDFPEAHYNLGNVLSLRGLHREAETSYRSAVALKPDFSLAHCQLGNVLRDEGRLAEAEAACRRALTLQPELSEAHNNLGTILKAQGRLDEAESSYRRALAIKPDQAEIHNNLGEMLRELGRLTEAENALRRALECKPDLAVAYSNLGNTLATQGRFAEAEAACRQALSYKPDLPEALAILGLALGGQERLSEAEASFRRVLKYQPDFAEAHHNLGHILRAQGRLSEAEASFRRTLELQPNLAAAFHNLGVTLTEQGRYAEAETACRQSLTIADDPVVLSALLFCLSHNEAIDAEALFAEHCRFGEQFEAPLRADWPRHPNRKDPDRCLQIGFVSADLRSHAVANFIEPVLAELAKYRQLSLHAYANHAVEDHVTQRLREHVAHWHPVAGMSESALAEAIRDDAIDILIDLSGHTAHHRLLTFARKPAPIQASWIGYPGTTGLPAMDYYLADRFLLPAGEFDSQFTEKIVRLPAGAPFLPFAGAPPVGPLPALSQGHITFGSFNRPTKISPAMVALWSQLLTALPNSRMLLGAMPQEGQADHLIDDFARHGISRERLSFHPRCDMQGYLELHQQVDICLDTFPYAGGTTTFHALWMGVPTLTLAGRTMPGRTGAAILGQLGLGAFISHNANEFVAQGIACTADLAALARLRAELRERLGQSAMGQPNLIAAGLERALRIMWQRWCDELPAETFEVRAQEARHGFNGEQNMPPAVTLDEALTQAFEKAVAYQNSGQLSEAEQLYQAILKTQPNHPRANHQLGLLELQRQQPATGLPHLMAALEACPEFSQYWLSALDALLLLGQVDTARQMLVLGQQHGLTGDAVDSLVLRLVENGPEREPPIAKTAMPLPGKPGNKPSTKRTAAGRSQESSADEMKTLLALFHAGHYSEGEALARAQTERYPRQGFGWKVLGAMLKSQGRDMEALEAMLQAARLLPRDEQVQDNLGQVLADMGQLSEAETCHRRALKIRRDFPEAHYNLGNVLNAQGHLQEAVASYRRAVVLKPGFPLAHYNLGNALMNQNRLSEAETAYRRTLALQPDLVEAHNNLGTILKVKGRLDEAETSYRRALTLKPYQAVTHYNLGNILSSQNRLAEAEAAWRTALDCKPDFPEVLVVLGSALNEQERLCEAEACFRRSLELQPDQADALLSLGVALNKLGRYSEAEAACRQSMVIQPDYDLAHSALLFCLSHNEAIDADVLFAEHCRFGEQFEAPLRANWPLHPNRKDPDRCLQIGFVSADLRHHAVANFIEPVLAELAKYRQLSLHAYANHSLEDHVTQRLREHVAHWHPVAGMSELALAEAISDDAIDILIDLSGHTAHHRLLTFARKPAPIQASWIGYPGTTGLQAMDYYLADRFLLPVGEFDGQFTEKIVRLPAGAPFLPFAGAPPVGPLPALSQRHITFGSFNRMTKISPSVVALWSQLLTALPNSRILLGAMPPEGQVEHLIDDFAHHGVTRERLSFHPRCDMQGYLELHQQVDICLDTFPYAGGTTTFHALWMGVPTLTLAGRTMPGRTGAAILSHVGLTAFIARNAREFVAQGIACSADLATLARLRAELRERLGQSAMGQPDLIAAGLERALRLMWQRWCDKLPAETFEVRAPELQQGLSAAQNTPAVVMREEATARSFDKVPTCNRVGPVDAFAPHLADSVPDQPASALSPRPVRPDNKLAGKRATGRSKEPAAEEVNTLVTLFHAGHYREGEVLARALTERFPEHGFGWKVLGAMLKSQGRDTEALPAMRHAARLLPRDAQVQSNLGLVLAEMDQLSEAEACHRHALKIKPNFPEAHYNLGNVLHAQRLPRDAEACYRHALTLEPDYAKAHNNLGAMLRELGRLTEAERALRRALECSPDFAKAHANLGSTLGDQGRLAEAETCFRRALRIEPDLVDASVNLALTLTQSGRYAEAEAASRQALQIQPDYVLAYSNLLFYLSHDEAVDAAELFAEHCRFGEQFEAPLRADWPRHPNRKDPDRCLQIGVVSADLYHHAVASFIEPVLAELAKYPQLSLHAYSNCAVEDHVTQRIRGHVAHWHAIAGMTDAGVAEKIREDGIDILIDLNGHTGHHRLLAFARKPAPIQVTWIGYPGTTGLQAMDYYLSDPFFLPRGEFDGQFTEKIVYLPCCSPFQPFADAPLIGPLPALSQGHVTFGSFNRPTKISASVIALWSRLLAAVPDSRMLLGAMPPDGRVEQLIDDFARHGIGNDRLSFHPRSTMSNYLDLHQRVDICLDTFPYNGGTTTFHALWMGVPTLTLAGGTFPGQTGAGILGHVGLPAFITRNATEFVERGATLAADLPLLAGLRNELRERLARSAFGEPVLIAAALERALRGMWQRWCHDLPAESFEVRRQDLP